MSRVIVVTSGKGGVGKSTCTAGIGTALAERGARVLLIDGDVGLNNLDVLLGINKRIVYDMADVIRGNCRVKQAILASSEVNNLFIMPSQHAYNSEDIGIKDFRLLIDKLRESFDYILIDCPAGIERGFHRAVAPANEAIVVTTPHVSALKDADKVLSILSSYALRGVNLMINRMRGDMVMSGDMISSGDISKLLGYPLIGVLPDDDGIHILSELGKLYRHDYRSRESFDCVAENIMTGKRRLYDPTAEYRGIKGRLRMLLKRA